MNSYIHLTVKKLYSKPNCIGLDRMMVGVVFCFT